MNKKEKLKYLTKLKIVLLSSLLCSSTNVKASTKEVVKKINNPKYATELEYDFNRMPYELDKYVKDNDINIFLLPFSNSAENYWRREDNINPGNIRGYTSIMNKGNKEKIDIYIESCSKPGYYEKYKSSSAGLTMDEFNYRLCKGTLMHELGHALDAKEKFSLSNNTTFKLIYDREKRNFRRTEEYNVENLKVDANINSRTEYFATAFSAFINHPGDLYRKCPLTYLYIDEYTKSIAKKYIKDPKKIEEISDSIIKYNNLLRNNYRNNSKSYNYNNSQKTKPRIYYKKRNNNY